MPYVARVYTTSRKITYEFSSLKLNWLFRVQRIFHFLSDGRMRQRRRRTAFTDEQLDRLEETFQSEKFPGIQIREDLAREMKIREDRIQVISVMMFLVICAYLTLFILKSAQKVLTYLFPI